MLENSVLPWEKAAFSIVNHCSSKGDRVNKVKLKGLPCLKQDTAKITYQLF